jgi:hypothetical protein
MPVVIVTHEDVVDPAPMMEVGASRNEYVTGFRTIGNCNIFWITYCPSRRLRLTPAQGESLSRHGVKLFAYHFWQRARQNCIYIEMPPPGDRNRSRINPFNGPDGISFYRRPGAVLSRLLLFNSQIS